MDIRDMTDSAVASIERSLLQLRRRQRRLTLAGSRPTTEIWAVEVADAIDSTGDQVAVGDISVALGIDPSQASRRVAAAVEAGLVRRHAA
jgi:DNA-binding MarR family transcriptional regulator